MKNHPCRFLIFLFLFLATACVSVKIPSASGNPAKDVKFDAPASPYGEIKISSADKAWLSSKTGNTISFISDCNSSEDPSLEQLQNDNLGVLEDLKVVKSDKGEFNGREALFTVAQGDVDGVPVETRLVIFKKNGCNYTLSYGGVLKTFESERHVFDSFVATFKAP